MISKVKLGFLIGLLTISVLTPDSAHAELRFTAKVFKAGSDKKDLLFNYRSEIEKRASGATVTNTFSYPDDKLAALETVEQSEADVTGKSTTGARFTVYKMSQKQTGADGQVEVRNGRAFFTYTKGGKTKTDDEAIKGNLVVGPTIPLLMIEHWSEITSGKKVEARMAVLDRLETVGFEFSKEKEEMLGGEKVIVIKMRPSSLLIAALVSPLHFYANLEGTKIREVHGRTHLKLKDGDGWKDLDAETVYDFK